MYHSYHQNIYLSIHPAKYLYIHQIISSIHIYVSMYLSDPLEYISNQQYITHTYICPLIFIFTQQKVYVSINIFMYLSHRLNICLSIKISIYALIYLPNHQNIYQFINISSNTSIYRVIYVDQSIFVSKFYDLITLPSFHRLSTPPAATLSWSTPAVFKPNLLYRWRLQSLDVPDDVTSQDSMLDQPATNVAQVIMTSIPRLSFLGKLTTNVAQVIMTSLPRLSFLGKLATDVA